MRGVNGGVAVVRIWVYSYPDLLLHSHYFPLLGRRPNGETRNQV